METRKQKSAEKTRDPDLAGAEAEMHRAAENIRRRAEETAGISGGDQFLASLTCLQ